MAPLVKGGFSSYPLTLSKIKALRQLLEPLQLPLDET